MDVIIGNRALIQPTEYTSVLERSREVCQNGRRPHSWICIVETHSILLHPAAKLGPEMCDRCLSYFSGFVLVKVIGRLAKHKIWTLILAKQTKILRNPFDFIRNQQYHLYRFISFSVYDVVACFLNTTNKDKTDRI